MQESYDEFIKKTMINQPTLNIGMIGHVANGKSTLTKDISGEATQRHSDEKHKNITIKLGYANAKIYKCTECPAPICYQSTQSIINDYNCEHCNKSCDLINHVSFVDCPGHNLLMATMLNGTCLMDKTILVEAATNDKIPELQTMEHYEIAQEAGVETSIICLNKLDLMIKNKNTVPDIIERLEKFTQSYNQKIPVIPISGTLKINIDVICEYIAKMNIPQRDLTDKFKMLIVRSFNINKCGKTTIQDLKGGVIGGSLIRGKINIGDDIYIYPGYTEKNEITGKWTYTPLKSKTLTINSGKTNLDYAIPGGLIGIQTEIDPYFTGDDRLTGQVIYSNKEKNIKVYGEITLKYKKITRKLTEYIVEYGKKFDVNDKLKINVNANNIICNIKNVNDEKISLILDTPVCLEIGESITISNINHHNHIEIFGRGIFEDGIECELK
jgi:translation initiation factor 2 subunit 3